MSIARKRDMEGVQNEYLLKFSNIHADIGFGYRQIGLNDRNDENR